MAQHPVIWTGTHYQPLMVCYKSWQSSLWPIFFFISICCHSFFFLSFFLPSFLSLLSHSCSGYIFFFFCVRCDDRAKSSGRWLLGSPPSAVVRQLAPRAWCPLQCLLAKTVGVLSPAVGRSEECAQEFAPQSHIHSGLIQQDLDLVSSDVFLVHSEQYADGRWWFGSSCHGC